MHNSGDSVDEFVDNGVFRNVEMKRESGLSNRRVVRQGSSACETVEFDCKSFFTI
jgi:hypothetical protein